MCRPTHKLQAKEIKSSLQKKGIPVTIKQGDNAMPDEKSIEGIEALCDSCRLLWTIAVYNQFHGTLAT